MHLLLAICCFAGALQLSVTTTIPPTPQQKLQKFFGNWGEDDNNSSEEYNGKPDYGVESEYDIYTGHYPGYHSSCNCHSSELSLISGHNKCYYFERTLKGNWFEGYRFCTSHGLRLASILSNSENWKLEEIMRQQGIPQVDKYWTSGSDLTGVWEWLGNMTHMNYTQWARGEPNNKGGNEHCVEVHISNGSDLEWNDYPCIRDIHIMCESDCDRSAYDYY